MTYPILNKYVEWMDGYKCLDGQMIGWVDGCKEMSG